jgi:hypothetical protein
MDKDAVKSLARDSAFSKCLFFEKYLNDKSLGDVISEFISSNETSLGSPAGFIDVLVENEPRIFYSIIEGKKPDSTQCRILSRLCEQRAKRILFLVPPDTYIPVPVNETNQYEKQITNYMWLSRMLDMARFLKVVE